jgi:hypothetical protein
MIFFFLINLGILILFSKKTLFMVTTKKGIFFSIMAITVIYIIGFKILAIKISKNFMPIFYIIMVSGIIFHLLFQLTNAVFLKKANQTK